ncbi:MAG: hypothetical protein U5P10_00545 [Spirochaetia bacterium]|nr:hypothetical protein [Spirochaetia bacterium]
MLKKSLVIVVFLSVFFAPVLYAQTKATEEQPNDKSIAVIHTSDLQRQILDEIEGGFGIADISAVVDYVDREGTPLVLGTGSFEPLPPGVDLGSDYAGLYVQLLEEIGYDAFVPGVHDFADGIEPLVELNEKTNFPFICANIMDNDRKPFQSSTVFEINGVEVGVCAVVSPEVVETLSGSSQNSKNEAGLELQNVLHTAAREVKKLEQSGAELIIAVTDIPLVDLYESGYFSDKELERIATTLSGQIDVVIEGSAAQFHEKPSRLGGTVFTGTGGSGHIGAVEIVVQGDNVADIRTRMIGPDAVAEANLEPMPKVVSLLEQLSVAMAQEDTEKTAQATETDEGEKKKPKPEEKEPEEEQPAKAQRRLPQLEFLIEPGLSLYSGAVGYGASLGVMSSFEELFDLGSPLSNVMLGLLLRYEGLSTSSPDLKLNAWGPALFGGYRFVLGDFFPDTPFIGDVRVIPRLTVGGLSLSIERDGNSDYSDFSMHIAPGVVVDKAMPLFEGLRAGITAEYRMTFAEKVLSNFHIGAFASWTY